MIEAALTLPLLLFIGLASIEYSNILYQTQMASVISREATVISYRRCAGERVQEYAEECLALAREFFSTRLTAIAPRAEVSVSLYVIDDDGFTPRLVASGAAPDVGSKFSVEAFAAPNSDIAKALVSHRQLMVGEVYIPYQPLFFGFPRFVPVFPDKLYDASLL